LKCSLLKGLSNLSKPQICPHILIHLDFRDCISNSAALKLQTVRFVFYFYLMHYQSIIFHFCYQYDLFASYFQTYAYVLIRWSDYLGVETFLFGACNNVHCKFRFIIGLNYTLYNFFSLLRTRSSLQYVIRRFTWETSCLFIRGVRKISKSDY
jgi:hypothetical protein